MADDAEVVADHEEGEVSVLSGLFKQVEDFGLNGGVECRCRLVQQQDFRLEDQRSGNGDALALAAGKLVRIAEAEAGSKADLIQRAGNAAFLVVETMDRQRLQQQRIHRLARMQRTIGVLKHHLDIAVEAFLAELALIGPPLHHEAALIEVVETGNGAQKRGFARTGLTDQTEGFALGDIDADTIERDMAVEIHEHVFNGKNCSHARHSGLRSKTGSGCLLSPIFGRQLSSPRV